MSKNTLRNVKASLEVHDVVFAGALTEEYPCDLPRLSEDLWRKYFEIDMQNVLVGKVDALDHMHITIVRHPGASLMARGTCGRM
jgi:hypothetical protein